MVSCKWVPKFRKNILPPSSTLKTEAICSSEKLVSTYQTTGCHDLQDHSMNLHRHEDLRLKKSFMCVHLQRWDRMNHALGILKASSALTIPLRSVC
jgi:hypothetical protein